MAKCIGRTQKDVPCKKTAQKGKPFCRIHEAQKLVGLRKIQFYFRKHWALYSITPLFGLLYSFANLVLPSIIDYFDILNPKVTLGLDQSNDDPNRVFLIFKNESKLFDILDLIIIHGTVCSLFEHNIYFQNSLVSSDETGGLNNRYIKIINPERTATIIYDTSYIIDDRQLKKGSVCFFIEYKGNIWFKNIKKTDTFGMYFDTDMKTITWKETPCSSLPMRCR